MTGSMLRRLGLLIGMLSAVAVASCGDAAPEGSMASGSHAPLACADCHLGATMTGPVPAVSEAACAACHETADLSPEETLQNVTLSHVSHPGLVEGTTLGCAGCHSHDTGESDLAIRTGSCFLCHAELPDAGTGLTFASIPESACATCHVQASHTAFPTSGAPIDHATVLTQGVSCVLCHFNVAEGTGAVPPATCRSCHGRADGPPALRDRVSLSADSIHAYHIADTFDTGCGRCHEPVDHHVIKLASSLVLDCTACHAPGDPALQAPLDSAAHRAEQQLYSGLDPHHTNAEPAVKFIERVSCNSCHSPTVNRIAGGPARVRAINAECVACHGSRFGNLLEPWIAGIRDNTGLVGGYVRAAATDVRVLANASAASLAREALTIWQHVDDADGVHNVPAADALLREALAGARSSFAAAGAAAPPMPQLGPDPQTVSCVRCHYGVQTLRNPIYGQTLDHEEHVVAGGLACAECHSSSDLFETDGRTFSTTHGLTPISQAACTTCHHVARAGDCVACHTAGEMAGLGLRSEITVRVQRGNVSRTRPVDFSHNLHGTLSCADCHQAGSASQAAASCAGCHESHHAESEASACTSCHGGAVRTLHQRTDHLVCGACHTPSTLTLLGTADRRFCQQCHTESADHNPDEECSTCHLLLTPEEAMRQIVTARTVPPGR